MTKHARLLASAPIAIAAVAALHTAPAMAQDAPTIVLDVPEPTAAQTPIVLPEPAPSASPAATTSAPVASQPAATTVAPVEASEPEPVVKKAATKPATAAPRETAASASPDASASSAAPLAAENADVMAATTDIPPAAAVSEDMAADEAQISANQSELQPVPNPVTDVSGAALLLALLAAGGIGLAAFFLMRSRRRRHAVPVIEKPIVAPAAPVVADESPELTYSDEPVIEDTVVAATPAMASSSGAAVELPAQVPTNPRERGNLLRRMIEARPDRANPFVSHKARAKRARLILQSIGTRFTNRKPGIDLSQYTNIWPELRGWRPATA